MSKMKQEVSTKQNVNPTTTTANQLPAELAALQTKHTGMEAMTTHSLRIPRLVLLQGLSPQLNDHPQLRKGQFFHSINKEGFDPPISVVPLHMRERCVIFGTDAMPKGIVTQSSDGVHWDEPDREFTYQKDKDSKPFKFTTGKFVRNSKPVRFNTDWGAKPIATQQLEVILALPELNFTPAVFVFQKTSLKIGEEWYSYFASNNMPLFAQYWKMGSQVKGEGTKSWNVAIVTKDGFIPLEIAKKLAAEVDRFAELAAAGKIEYDDVKEDNDSTDTSDGTDNAIAKRGKI